MKRFQKWMVGGAAAVAILAVGGGAVTVLADANQSDTTISKGVFIEDVDLSGMTKEQAESAVNEKVKEMQSAQITLKVGTDTVTATASELGVKWENTQVLEEAAGIGKSGNLIKRYKDNKDLEKEPKVLELEYTADMASAKTFVENKCKAFEKEKQDGSLTRVDGEFQLEPGVIGQKVNVESSVQAIVDYINLSWQGTAGTVELSVEQDIPRGTEEELSQIQDLLGTATTYYGSTSGRNQNVERGAQLLDGHLLYPGESFSVTDAVVPFNAENGYEMAPSYESGRVVDSYGGGICQVSTTLYNALLRAELNVTERSNHTMIVTYVEPSMDAAIAEGLMDLKFENNTDAPIYIAGYAYGGELTFSIYGKEYRSSDRSVEYISEVVSTKEPEGVALYAKTDANVGYISQIQSGHQGMEARLWKVVTENGQTEKTQVNSSTYQAAALGYEIGTANASADVAAALNNAIAANDLNAVQTIIGGGGVQTPTTEAPVVETPTTDTPATDTPATDESESDTTTDTPATDTPTTDAPITDPSESNTPDTTPNGGDEDDNIEPPPA